MIYFSLHLTKSDIFFDKRDTVIAVATVNITAQILLVINEWHATALTPVNLLPIIVSYGIEK